MCGWLALGLLVPAALAAPGAPGGAGHGLVVPTDRGLVHRSDLTGVRLDLHSDRAVRAAYRHLRDTLTEQEFWPLPCSSTTGCAKTPTKGVGS